MSVLDSVLRILPSPVLDVDDWGYSLLPPSHRASPGAAGLVVTIRAKPTGKHFDPERIMLHTLGVQNKPERLTLERKPPQTMNSRVCMGDVTLVDRLNKSVEFFTFGGCMEFAQQPDETIYTLRSPAPILQLFPDMENIQDQFVSEVELELSALHARCGAHDGEFERHLAGLDAESLYGALLRELWRKYSSSKPLQATFPHLYKMLAHEVEWLEQNSAWREWGPSLDDVIGLP